MPDPADATVELARRHILHDTSCIARHTSATSCVCDWPMRVATLAGDIRAALAAARAAERERCARECDRQLCQEPTRAKTGACYNTGARVCAAAIRSLT